MFATRKLVNLKPYYKRQMGKCAVMAPKTDKDLHLFPCAPKSPLHPIASHSHLPPDDDDASFFSKKNTFNKEIQA